MTGLDKIIGQIRQEGEETAATIIAAARKNSDDKLEKIKADVQKECEAIDRNSEEAVADSLSRARSAASLYERKAILAKKQQLISEIFTKAVEKLDKMDDKKYFAIIERMVSHYHDKGDTGTITFSKRDLKRLPSGFQKSLDKITASDGGKLTISDKTANINGGFILSYGGIEENCSFEALLAESHDTLQDKLGVLLFA